MVLRISGGSDKRVHPSSVMFEPIVQKRDVLFEG